MTYQTSWDNIITVRWGSREAEEQGDLPLQLPVAPKKPERAPVEPQNDIRDMTMVEKELPGEFVMAHTILQSGSNRTIQPKVAVDNLDMGKLNVRLEDKYDLSHSDNDEYHDLYDEGDTEIVQR